MPRWGQVDARTHNFLPENTAYQNYVALRAAYIEAAELGVPLYIPSGVYSVQLAPGDIVVRLNAVPGGGKYVPAGPAPIVGAGAESTVLNFRYPEGTEPPSRSENLTAAFAVVAESDVHARIAGLSVIMAEWVGGAQYVEGSSPFDPDGNRQGDGRDAPNVMAVYASATRTLAISDVCFSGWNTAIHADGAAPETLTLHLERCHVRSRGTRVACASGGLTLIDCTIDQDDDGFVFSGSGFYPGVYTNKDVALWVVGGRSLGNRPVVDNSIYAFYSQGVGQRVAIRDHYFGPRVSVAMEFLVQDESPVLMDNCTFESSGGIYIAGGSGVRCTYHVSNCSFHGTSTLVGDLKSPTQEVEAHFTNCRFVSTGTAPIIWRWFGDQERPWYFKDCYFEQKGTGSIVRTQDGVMIFFNCVLNSTGAMEPIVQRHGHLELYDCTIEAAKSCYFITEGTESSGVPETNGTLSIHIERCDLRIPMAMYFVPTNAIRLTGAENTFGDGGTSTGRLAVENRGAGDPALLESDLRFRRRRGTYNHIATYEEGGVRVPSHIRINLNADWYELSGVSEVEYIFLHASWALAYADGSVNFPVGATIALVAVDPFVLRGSGNIALRLGLSEIEVPAGSVATLRYTSSIRAWVVVSAG
jgi:hypothetical protein